MNEQENGHWSLFDLIPGGYTILKDVLINEFDFSTALWLSCLVRQHSFLASRCKMPADGYFYMEQEFLMRRSKISKKLQCAARKELEQAGLIKSELRGSPPRRYYKLSWEALSQLGASSDQEPQIRPTGEFKFSLPATSIYNNTKNNNIHNSTAPEAGAEKVVRVRRRPPVKREPTFEEQCVTIWNDLQCGRQHSTGTKTYSTLCRYIEQLMKGTFKDGKYFDPKFLESNGKLLSKRWSRTQIKEGIRRLKSLFTEGYWPPNKERLPRDLPTLIYNQGTGKSWLFLVLDKEPQPLATERRQKAVAQEQFKMYNNKVLDLLEWPQDSHRYEAEQLMKKIASWQQSLPKDLIEHGALRRMFGDERKAIATYLEHLEEVDLTNIRSIVALEPGNWVFDNFLEGLSMRFGGINLSGKRRENGRTYQAQASDRHSDREADRDWHGRFRQVPPRDTSAILARLT